MSSPTQRNLLGFATLVVACTTKPAQQTIGDSASGKLGQIESELPSTFSEITDVAPLPDGRVVVIDPRDSAIVIADFAKGTAKKIGRSGEGPREYRSLGHARVGTGDTVWVSDWRAQVFHLVSPAGEILERTVRWPRNDSPQAWTKQGVLYAPAVRFNQDSMVLARFTPVPANAGDRSGLLHAETPVSGPRVAYRQDSLLRLSTGSPKTTTHDISSNAAGESMVSVSMEVSIWGMGDGWAMFDDGTIGVIRSKPYRVDIVDTSGRVTIGQPVAYSPIAVPDSDRGARTPKFKPAFYTGSPFEEDPIASATALWVRRTTPNDSAPHEFDLFDRTGRLVAQITLPDKTRLIGFTPGFVYLARETDDGGMKLLRYREPK